MGNKYWIEWLDKSSKNKTAGYISVRVQLSLNVKSSLKMHGVVDVVWYVVEE